MSAGKITMGAGDVMVTVAAVVSSELIFIS